VLQRFRGELTMLDGKGEGGGRSYEDEGGGFKSGAKRSSDGPRESFNQDLDDEIPF
jgi:single-strand DNA-binding protein